MDDEDGTKAIVEESNSAETPAIKQELLNHKTNGNLTPPTNVITVESDDEESDHSVLTVTSDSCELVIDQDVTDACPSSKQNGEQHQQENELKRKADELNDSIEFEPAAKQKKLSDSPTLDHEIERPKSLVSNEYDESSSEEDVKLDHSIDSGKSSLNEQNDSVEPEINSKDDEDFNESSSDSSSESSDNESQKPALPPLGKLVLKRDGMNNLTVKKPLDVETEESSYDDDDDEYSETSEEDAIPGGFNESELKEHLAIEMNEEPKPEASTDTENKDFFPMKNEEQPIVPIKTETVVKNNEFDIVKENESDEKEKSSNLKEAAIVSVDEADGLVNADDVISPAVEINKTSPVPAVYSAKDDSNNFFRCVYNSTNAANRHYNVSENAQTYVPFPEIFPKYIPTNLGLLIAENNGPNNGAHLQKANHFGVSQFKMRPMPVMPAAPVMPVLPAIDFSNFLDQNKMFNQQNDFLKISYNKPNKSKYPVNMGINSGDFIDDSSDTLDESENRLVIAEKQRKSRCTKANSTSTVAPVATQSAPPPTTIKARNSEFQTHFESVNKPNNNLNVNKNNKLANSVNNNNSNNSVSNKSVAKTPASNQRKDKKKVFLCSPCGTYYENWNLFLHMREIHKKYICLYCLGIFQSAEKLVNHLEIKHQVRKKYYANIEEYVQQCSNNDRVLYIMCSKCQHVFEKNINSSVYDDEIIANHNCNDFLEKCLQCGCFKAQKHKCSKTVIAPPPPPSSSSSSSLPSSNNLNNISNKFNNNNINKKIISNPGAVMLFHKNNNNLNNSLSSTQTSSKSIFRERDKHFKANNNHNKLNNIAQNLQMPPNLAHNSPILSSHLMRMQSFPLPSLYNPNNPMSYPPFNHLTPSTIAPATTPSTSTSAATLTSTSTPTNNINNLNNNNKVPKVSDELKSSQNEAVTNNTNTNNICANPATTASTTDNEESNVGRLLVPKLKVRIPKEYCTPIESEESSTESDYNDEEDEDYDDDFDEDEDLKSIEANDVDKMEVDMDIEEPLPPTIIRTPSPIPPSPLPSPSVVEEEKAKEVEAEPEAIVEPEPPIEIENPPVVEPVVEPEITPEVEPEAEPEAEPEVEPEDITPKVEDDGIVIASEEAQLFELTLDEPLDKIPIIEFMKTCLKVTIPYCLYCNHARRIAVNAKYLALHFIAMHRFEATVNSITAEELLPGTIVTRLKQSCDELEKFHFNLETYDSSWSAEEKAVTYPKQFECFQCRFITGVHKELYLHNRKMHQKSILICIMCRANFYSYSELLCHICPGVANQVIILDYTFRCCLCNLDNIPSAFRLMVHLRKRHFACDVCLEECFDQSRLSNHVWKHKLHHLCYRCGIAYRNKADIMKHLFWKHGTESVLCKKCMQKKWPHVYHFCIPPPNFACDVCNMTFAKSVALKVHKRLHSGDAPYPCTEDNCEKKFISRKLLLKHVARHYEPPPAPRMPTPPPVSPVREKTPIKSEDLVTSKKEEKDEKKPSDSTEDQHVKKGKKKKKSKDDEKTKNLVDLMNLPALNLSESDSSDDSDHEKQPPQPSFQMQNRDTNDDMDITDDSKPTSIVDIWENFKSYQAQNQKSIDEDNGEENYNEAYATPILHVTQSDHDYCLMYKKIITIKEEKMDIKEEHTDGMKLEKDVKSRSLLLPQIKNDNQKGESSSPRKNKKSPRKIKNDTASSSSDSSDSDSSCECGSNCSCSSSSSSNSSSSSDSDSSAKKSPKKKHAPKTIVEPVVEPMQVEEEKPIPLVPVDPDSIIFESDLETEESDTDEDFYDDHPQKLANQMLAEKRKQLMLQTCMSPVNSYGIVENSRPSTPSLPEEMSALKKKVKVKKKKKDRKSSKHASLIPPLIINIPTPSKRIDEMQMMNTGIPSIPMHMNQQHDDITMNSSPNATPLLKITTPRLSTGNSSESDAHLKRSQRSRKPNKFYGYTSDEEFQMAALSTPLLNKSSLSTSILSVMKPTPPPNLTWSKEDLPSPPSSGSKTKTPKSIKSPATFTKTLNNSIQPDNQYPPIPPVIIRPSQIPQQNSHPPPRVIEPLRIPAVPVHHISPEKVDPSSDSNSSDEDALHITQEPLRTPKSSRVPPPLPKLKLSTLSKKIKNSFKTNARKKTPKGKVFPGQKVTPLPIIAPPYTLTHPNDELAPKVPPIGSFPRIHSEFFRPNQIRIPAGWRPPREGESVYCYCRCPYDEVSEMIACDGDDCNIEWFHFECVGIIMPPKGKWYCPECKLKYMNHQINNLSTIDNNEIQDKLLDSN